VIFRKFAYVQYVCGGGHSVTLALCKSHCYFLFIDSEWWCLHGFWIIM